jgi:hypothetical protein
MNRYLKLLVYTSGLLLIVAAAGRIAVWASDNQRTTSAARAPVTTVRQEMQPAPLARPVVLLPTPTPAQPLPTPESTAPACAEICDPPAAMAVEQRVAYLQGLAGKRIVGWQGYVAAIERWDRQQYTIKIDMRGDRFFRSPQVEILQVSRERAMQLQIGQPLLFDGLIWSIPLAAEGNCTPIYVVATSIIPQ